MVKTYVNKITHKDSNKLGKRKQKIIMNRIIKELDSIQEYSMIGYK